MKRALIVLGLIACVITICFAIYKVVGQEEYISTEFIEIDEVIKEGEEWIVRGRINMDEEKILFMKKGLSGFESRKEKNNFIISLKYGVVSGNPTKSFEVYLDDDLDSVNKVYLQGKSLEELELILEK